MRAQKLGVDAGGSLVKIAIEENGQFHYKKYGISNIQEAVNWLSIMAQQAEVTLTGGKADFLRKNYFPTARVVSEFDASCEGANFLLKKAAIKIDRPFLLANIGTGTSWYKIAGNQYERVLGSGIGGGTFMGLGRLLTNKVKFNELVELAENGDKGKVDLLVNDIYAPDKPPIDGKLTASNYAKAAVSQDHSEYDRMASTVNMIAETIVLLSKQTAAVHHLSDVVFIGSTLIRNSSFQEGLNSLSKMVGLTPTFLKDGEFSGAVGSIIMS